MPSNLMTIDGKKFIWDGVDYPGAEKVAERVQTYKREGFEVEMSEVEGRTYLYTRRVVKEATVEKT